MGLRDGSSKKIDPVLPHLLASRYTQTDRQTQDLSKQELCPLWPWLSTRKMTLGFLGVLLFSLPAKGDSKFLAVMRWTDGWRGYLQPQTSSCPAEDGMGPESTLITRPGAVLEPHGMPSRCAPSMYSTGLLQPKAFSGGFKALPTKPSHRKGSEAHTKFTAGRGTMEHPTYP